MQYAICSSTCYVIDSLGKFNANICGKKYRKLNQNLKHEGNVALTVTQAVHFYSKKTVSLK